MQSSISSCACSGIRPMPLCNTASKSITTAIGMGVSEEAGGIVTLTVISIIITGVLGNMVGETVLKLAKIHHPVAKRPGIWYQCPCSRHSQSAGIRRSRRRY
mgnify:CR=1 FL=1